MVFRCTTFDSVNEKETSCLKESQLLKTNFVARNFLRKKGFCLSVDGERTAEMYLLLQSLASQYDQ